VLLQGYYRKGEIESATEHYKEAIESYQVTNYSMFVVCYWVFRAVTLLVECRLSADVTDTDDCTESVNPGHMANDG